MQGASTADALAIRAEGLAKWFTRPSGRSDRYLVFENLDLQVEDGEFFCLLGPSGCGKTTLLDIVAGFEPPSAGLVKVFGEPVTGPGADRGVVFQNDRALFSWLTVEENVSFGLRMRGLGKRERKEIVERNLELVGLAQHRGKFPTELSGGMKQRVQIARVLASDPRILLMDEPFAALDAQTRKRMQKELEGIWQRTRKAVLFITHEISEAIKLGDRVAVMTKGPRSRISKIVPVPLLRPRDDHLTPEFLSLYNQLNDEIEIAEGGGGWQAGA